jgi:hypothetical protein
VIGSAEYCGIELAVAKKNDEINFGRRKKVCQQLFAAPIFSVTAEL